MLTEDIKPSGAVSYTHLDVYKRQVVEDPFVVTNFFLDIVGDCTAQPFLVIGEAGAAGHEQGSGMLDVMEGTGEEVDVIRPTDPTCQSCSNDRRRKQIGAFVSGGLLELLEVVHVFSVLIKLDAKH